MGTRVQSLAGESRAGGHGDDIRLTVAGVAARLGVAAPTLRTWDRRYGLGPSEHVAGSHRRYAARDIARLETMRRLTLDGVAPADAARIALRGGVPTPAGEVEQRSPEPAPEEDVAAIVDPLTLAAAAVEADQSRVNRLIRRSQHDVGLLESWQMLVRPALEMVAMREHSDRPGRDPEQVLRTAMLSLVSDTAGHVPPQAARVAVYPEAGQMLDGHVLAGELTRQGAQVQVLHPRLGEEGPEVVLESVRRRAGTLTVLIGEPAGAERIAGELCADGEQVFVVALTDVVLPRPGLHRARTMAGAAYEIMSLLTSEGDGRAAG